MRFGADSCQKYEDFVQKYQAWPRWTAAWIRHQNLKTNNQLRSLARPVLPATHGRATTTNSLLMLLLP